jgi:hypothetical protein
VAEQEDDLRATTEDIRSDAEELAAIEEEKARLDSEDPRQRSLSRKGERLARRLAPKTAAERELADETTGAAEDSSPGEQPTRTN